VHAERSYRRCGQSAPQPKRRAKPKAKLPPPTVTDETG
jgi:hypothetical protein